MAHSIQSISKKESDRKYYLKNKDILKQKASRYYYEISKERLKNKLASTTCCICQSEFIIREDALKRSVRHICSKECLKIFRQDNLSGEKSYLWKGGISTEYRRVRNLDANKNWIKEIFVRDNYTCIKCNKQGVKLTAHHIFNFSKLYLEMDKQLWDINNGVTLCLDCHKEFHRLYGKKDNNINQIKEFTNGR